MTPEQAAVEAVPEILITTEDMAAAVSRAGKLAALCGISFEEFSVAIAASGEEAAFSLRSFILALDGRSPEAKQTIANIGVAFRDTEGRILAMRGIGAELNTKLRAYRAALGENVAMAIVETIFGGGTPTALGLMALAKEEAA